MTKQEDARRAAQARRDREKAMHKRRQFATTALDEWLPDLLDRLAKTASPKEAAEAAAAAGWLREMGYTSGLLSEDYEAPITAHRDAWTEARS